MILFILQNAYRSEKYNFRNEEEWSSDLMRSQTGKRLKEMIPENSDYRVINSSDKIGNNADSCYNADVSYIQKWIEKIQPRIICACGKIAQDGCEKLGLNFVKAPHPAWRQLSKKETKRIQNLLINQ